MNSFEPTPQNGVQPEPAQFDIRTWIVEEQQLLENELEIIENSKPNRLQPIEEQIAFGRKSAEILGRHYELTLITKKLNQNK